MSSRFPERNRELVDTPLTQNRPGLLIFGSSLPMNPRQLRIADFSYELPEERIAQQPLAKRDDSRMLLYADGQITDEHFRNLPELLPKNSLLLFNNTRVVRARLLFPKSSGATIELFCLEPLSPSSEIQQAMLQTGEASWLCLIGNNRRWKDGILLLNAGGIQLSAKRGEKKGDAYEITFSWSPCKLTFAELLEKLGHIPLPPYMKRPDTEADAERYQTVFARYDGSVAAPTASLHFSPEILSQLEEKEIQSQELTLHVGAGTFKPVKADAMADHDMHREEMMITPALIDRLLKHDGPIIPVGTTALRCLESLYWLGVLLQQQPETDELPEIGQFTPYDSKTAPGIKAALLTLQQYLSDKKQHFLPAYTALMIAPGYRFRLAQAVITNFHQPQSTLLLLVAAAIGADWKKVYDHALAGPYRFLSYGDSSLLWIKPENRVQ